MSEWLCIIRPPRPTFMQDASAHVLVAETEGEAWELVRADPSVRAGIQTPELYPFRASLVAGRPA